MKEVVRDVRRCSSHAGWHYPWRLGQILPTTAPQGTSLLLLLLAALSTSKGDTSNSLTRTRKKITERIKAMA